MPPTLKDQKLAKTAELRAIATEAGDRAFTDDEKARIKGLMNDVRQLDGKLAQVEADAGLLDSLKSFVTPEEAERMKAGGSPRQAPQPGPWAKSALKFLSNIGAKDLTPSGSITTPQVFGGIVTDGEQPRSLLALPATKKIDGTDTFSYLREITRTHAAAPVAEGAVKPTSTYSVERRDDKVQTIAHLTEPIPRQTLADEALLVQYLDGALRQGWELAVETQLLSGSGVAPNLTGLADTSGVQTQAWTTDFFTTARNAITKVRGAIANPNLAFVVAPEVAQTIDLAVDSQNRFYGAGPFIAGPRSLWGVPVVESQAIGATDPAWLADWSGSTLLVHRDDVTVDWSENTFDATANASDFQRNLVRFRAEARVGFAVTRPLGVVQVATHV